MLKLMIVDDEIIVRRGIRTSIEWHANGIDVIGEASNGKDALEQIATLQPDIILTDIKMPIMDGLELSKKVKELYPHICIVILSGHDDFAYAKEAINLKVDEYILKPFGKDELTQLVVSLKEKILQDKERHEVRRTKELLMEDNLPFLQRRFVMSLLTKTYNDYTYIKKNASMVHIDLCGPYYQVIIIDIDQYHLLTENMTLSDIENLKQSILNITSCIFNEKSPSTFCELDHSTIIGIVNLTSTNKVHLLGLCDDIKSKIMDQLHRTITISIGEAYKDITMLKKSYKDASEALMLKLSYGENTILFGGQNKLVQKEIKTTQLLSAEGKLLLALQESKIQDVTNILDEIFTEIVSAYVTNESIRQYCTKLILQAIISVERQGIEINSHSNMDLNIYEKIKSYDTLETLKEWTLSILEKLINIITQDSLHAYNKITMTAIEYMRLHYKENITLTTLSEITYVTPNYFSRIFKEQTGQSYVEWLNIYRVNKSKLLLHDIQYKSYEIAVAVGFSDYKHYAHNFKKYTGETLSSYKNRLLSYDTSSQ